MEKSTGMLDVGGKDVSVRTASAIGSINLGSRAFKVLQQGSSIKGDVLTTAKIAAIQAVKSTPAIIPMCHTIVIEAVDVAFELDNDSESVTTKVIVRSSGKTGVEMEALTGVSAACLTIYDMLRYTGKAMTITQVRLIEKTGGKSGDFRGDQ